MADRTVQVDLLNVQRVKDMLAHAEEEIGRLRANLADTNAALTSVSDLLDGARTERDALLNEMERLRGELAEERTRHETDAVATREAERERDEARAELSEARQRVRDRDKWLSDLEDAMPEEVDVESLPQSLRLWIQGVAETEQELTAVTTWTAAVAEWEGKR